MKKDWYTPTTPCQYCGTMSARRKTDDLCHGCFPDKFTCDKCGGKKSDGKCHECTLDTNPDSPRQKAIRVGAAWYTPETPCTHCGGRAPHSVSDGTCLSCTSARQEAILSGKAWYTPSFPCAQCGTKSKRRVTKGKCLVCNPRIREGDPRPSTSTSPRQEALRSGAGWYTPETPCRYCGTLAKRRVTDSKCLGCHPPKSVDTSPRQEALHSGEVWYTPTRPCRYCGSLAKRKVRDGACSACIPEKLIDGRKSGASLMREANPDMLLSRKAAMTLNIPTYRTGKPCRYGHTGWRYVTTQGCITCKETLDKG